VALLVVRRCTVREPRAAPLAQRRRRRAPGDASAPLPLRSSVALLTRRPLSQPTGGWRRGSFEVVNLATGELLYSKMATGQHISDAARAQLVERLG